MQTSATETLLLGLLAGTPEGAFGSELVHRSNGRVKRGSVYALLAKLEKAGFVEGVEDCPSEVHALPRTRYKLTASGARARQEFAAWTGLIVPSKFLGDAV